MKNKKGSFKKSMSYFLFMQRKYKAGLITKEEGNVIEQKGKEFEQRGDLLPINTSNYSKPEDNIEQLDDYDEEQQALLKGLYVPRKNSNTANNTKDTSVITYDDDKKLAKKISKGRKEEELKRKEEEQKTKVLSEDDEMRRRYRKALDKGPGLKYNKILPKRTSKIITLRHDDEEICHTACFFRLNSKKRIRLSLYFESLKGNKEDILSMLEKSRLGVYILINNKNNKFYIGSSANLPQRMKYYMKLDIKKTYKEDNLRTIEKAIIKHGIENFSFGILGDQDHYGFKKSDNGKKKVLDAEQEYIDFYHPHYNDVKASRIPLED